MGNSKRKKKAKPTPKNRNPQFRAAGRSQQQTHRQPLYGLCWGRDIHVDRNGDRFQYLASCGSRVITIYEIDIDNRNPKSSITLRQSYKDEDKDEYFYACAFAGRSKYWGKEELEEEELEEEDDDSSTGSKNSGSLSTARPKSTTTTTTAGTKRPREENAGSLLMDSENEEGVNSIVLRPDSKDCNGPQLLCIGGSGGMVKIIDLVQKRQIETLTGHGSDIYDVKASPTNEFLLLTASVDESIRLWNLDSFACVAIFAGQHGHRESVLSVSWHVDGFRFASSGMDKSVRLWDIREGRISEALQASSSKLSPTSKRKTFNPVCRQFPYFATQKVHLNYVDCVQFLGDMILSKSTYNTINLWLPVIPESPKDAISSSAAYCPPSDVIALRTFELDHCNIWFVRFATDNMGRLLAVGNIKGEVDVWDIDSGKKKPSQTLRPIVSSTIRTLAFSPDGKTLMACNDTAMVCRWNEA